MNYIIYHSKRCISQIGEITVYHDCFDGNQDPYIWNERFLHSFCHITQLKDMRKGDIIFWVGGDTYPDFTKLYCDCVFIVDEKIIWKDPNLINVDNLIVDNEQAYEHHYKWAHCQHNLKKRSRYTLKADSTKSYQPQNNNNELIDIVPILNQLGIPTETLLNKISKTINGKRAINSKPYKLTEEFAQELNSLLWEISDIKLTGDNLKNIHPHSNDKS